MTPAFLLVAVLVFAAAGAWVGYLKGYVTGSKECERAFRAGIRR